MSRGQRTLLTSAVGAAARTGYLLLLGVEQRFRERAMAAALRCYPGAIGCLTPDAPGNRLFDVRLVGDPRDAVDAVAAVWTHTNRTGERPVAVVPFNDGNLAPAVAIAEEYGLPSLPPRVVCDCRNKDAMKQRLAAAGLPVARHFAFRTYDEMWAYAHELGFPVVVKPAEFGGSGGVTKADDADGLLAAFQQAQGVLAEHAPAFHIDPGAFQVEEYVPAVAEVSVEVLAGLVNGWPRDCMVGGARRAYVNGCLVDPKLGVTERRRVVRQVVDAVTERAAQTGDDAVAWMYVPTEPAADLAAATGTRPMLTGADTLLVLPGTTMADYWASYRPGRRSRARREATVFVRSSYTTAVERLGECHEEAGPLLGQVERKYGRPADDRTMIASLATQAEHLDDCSRVFTCRRDGRLVGFALFYAWRDGLYGRLVGFDYPRLRSSYEYFNLLFYEPVRYAYDHGARFLHLGIESTATKCLRGATARPLWTVLSSRNWSLPSRDEITGWNQRGLREWARRQEEVGAVVTAEWGDEPWGN